MVLRMKAAALAWGWGPLGQSRAGGSLASGQLLQECPLQRCVPDIAKPLKCQVHALMGLVYKCKTGRRLLPVIACHQAAWRLVTGLCVPIFLEIVGTLHQKIGQ